MLSWAEASARTLLSWLPMPSQTERQSEAFPLLPDTVQRKQT